MAYSVVHPTIYIALMAYIATLKALCSIYPDSVAVVGKVSTR